MYCTRNKQLINELLSRENVGYLFFGQFQIDVEKKHRLLYSVSLYNIHKNGFSGQPKALYFISRP